MPTPYKPTRPTPIPPDAERVDVDGRPHIRLRVRGKAVLFPVCRDGMRYLRPIERYYFKFRGKPVKGFKDLKATEQLAAEMERKEERKDCGLIDPAEEHARRPLAEHLKDYAAALEAKGNCPEHNRATVRKLAAMFKGCGFVFFKDVDAGRASGWLAEMRRPARMPDIPPGDHFSTPEAAAVLGISADSVRRFVARHRLPTVGNGPARRLPRTTVEAVAELATTGNGPATVNHYVRAARGFFRWLVKAKRIGSNPIDSLTLLNTATDIRRGRRELDADDLRQLLTAARDSLQTFRGLTGRDRYFLYLTAAATGFRANALANLTPADFDLTEGTVTLRARFNKSRRLKVQPLPADVTTELADFLTGKAAADRVWSGTWASGCSAAEMVRRDLEAAGIPYMVEGPDGPEYADFHSLRHTYLTMLGRNGVDLRTAQELAGHSTPLLTARYSHRRLHDLAGAVEKLPNIVPTAGPTSTGAEFPLRMTGTDGARTGRSDVPPDVPADVPTGGAGPHRSALKYTSADFGPGGGDLPEPLKNKAVSTIRHPPASRRSELPGQDSNLNKESQNLLCYRYTTG